MYQTKEAIRKGRYDAVPFVLYFDQDDEDSVYGYNWGKETGAGAHQVFLVGPGQLQPFLELVRGLLFAQQAAVLTDIAAAAVTNFAAMGEERQAMLASAVWHLQQEWGSKYFDPEHPDKDPLHGINERLTAAEGGAS